MGWRRIDKGSPGGGWPAAAVLGALGVGVSVWLGAAGASSARAGAAPRLPVAAAATPRVGPVGRPPITSTIASTPVTPAGPVLGPFGRRWVAVPVATVWDHADTARPEDGPAVAAQPDVDGWVKALDYRQKLGLDDLLATQVLFDQPVLVYGHDGSWDHVLIPGQTGAVYPFGVAGWVPASQLTAVAPPPAATQATVAVPRVTVAGHTFSYGTRLPVARAGSTTAVVMPSGRFPVPAGSVRTGVLPASGAAVVAEAERFLGLPYLWAGTSAFGFDCSGLTYTVYRQFGVHLARDAGDQAHQGVPVPPSQLAPGDLVFFSFGGPVDHVGIYAGHGMMLHSPETGAPVELVPMWGTPLARAFAGARRYLPG